MAPTKTSEYVELRLQKEDEATSSEVLRRGLLFRSPRIQDQFNLKAV